MKLRPALYTPPLRELVRAHEAALVHLLDPPSCPSCGRPLKPDLVCWGGCGWRGCECCGKDTGSEIQHP